MPGKKNKSIKAKMKEKYLRAIIEEIDITLDKIDRSQQRELLDIISGSPRLFIAGRGRTGLVMNAFAIRMMQMGFKIHVVGEPTTPSIMPGDLLLIGSGSGETASLVVMSEKARKAGAGVALITMDNDSAIAGNADVMVVIPAGGSKTDKDADTDSMQPMCNLFEQCLLLFLDALTISLMEEKKIDVSILYDRHANLE